MFCSIFHIKLEKINAAEKALLRPKSHTVRGTVFDLCKLKMYVPVCMYSMNVVLYECNLNIPLLIISHNPVCVVQRVVE